MEGFQFDFRCDVQPRIDVQASTSTPKASSSKRPSATFDLRGASPKAGSKRKAAPAPAPAFDLTSITSSEPSTSASEQDTQSEEEDDDSELELVRKSAASGSGQQQRQVYTILDSENESADDEEEQQQRKTRQESTPRRTSTRGGKGKGKQRVIEPDSEDEEVLFSLTKPSQTPTTTPSKSKQPARITLGSPVKASKPAFERPKIVIQDDSDDQDSDCDADSTFREDEHNALFNACLAECAPGAPLPLMVFDLMDLQRGSISSIRLYIGKVDLTYSGYAEWKDKMTTLALTGEDARLLRSLLFDSGHLQHHPLRYWSMPDPSNSDDSVLDIPVYVAPHVSIQKGANDEPLPRTTFFSSTQVHFLLHEIHSVLSMSEQRSLRRTRFTPRLSQAIPSSSIAGLRRTQLDKLPDLRRKGFRRGVSKVKRAERLAHHTRRAKQQLHQRVSTSARGKLVDHDRPAKRRRTSALIPCWTRRPCIRGSTEMRQLIANAKKLVKAISKRTGAILSVDTEGGSRMTEFGFALHRWFKPGEDLQEPPHQADSVFDAQMKLAVQQSLNDVRRLDDASRRAALGLTSGKGKEVQEETIIRHFFATEHPKGHPARNFLLGESERLRISTIKQRLSGIFDAVDLSTHCVLLIAHAPFAELQAFQQTLDIDTSRFQWLDGLAGRESVDLAEPKGVVVLDTQQLMQCHRKSAMCLSLQDACKDMGIDTVQLHNAANDGWFAMELLQAILNA